MNTLQLAGIMLLSILWYLPAIGQWSSPVQITSGSEDDEHPSFVNTLFPESNSEEVMAFSRTSSIGSNICLMKTQHGGHTWVDTVFEVTHDSAGNDFPSLSRTLSPSGPVRTMLLWQRGGADPQIWYTLSTNGEWSVPSPVVGDSSSGRSPCVVPNDSGFGAVWEHGGRIVYAEFDDGTWTSPEYVTPAGDTGNSSPVLRYLGYRPWVMWTKVKTGGNDHAIKHSLYMGTLWSFPDTVAEAGDNQHPRFDKPGFRYMNASVSYESNITGDWEIYGRTADGAGGYLYWIGQADNVSQNPLADDRFASFMNIPIITAKRTAQSWFYFFAGTWVVQSATGDSILVTSGPYDRSYKTVAPGTVSRNPDLSCGVFSSIIRVWSVWENNATGVWKLYGTFADIVVGVGQEEPMPASFRLDQNYPNPFNPTTMVNYQLPVASKVRLVVYDILGREVAVLANERKAPGSYSVKFDGSHLASGVYFYRLVAGSFVETKRLLLVR